MPQESKETGRMYSGYMRDADMIDNKRRGNPIAGCDCVTCFGRCLRGADSRPENTIEFRPLRETIDEGDFDDAE